MATTQEQGYYELLVRTDHPVFRKDFSAATGPSSPFNSILNRLIAKQLVKLRAEIDAMKADSFPQSCTGDGIGKWEETYFGQAKAGGTLPDRQDQVVQRINTRLTMSVSDVIALAEAITGKTPEVIRNMYTGGWVLGQSVLGLDTILSGGSQANAHSLYVVVFYDRIDSVLLKLLDKELSRIEKGGSRHGLVSRRQFWVLGQSALGVNTILG
jgi:hypothetical protein